MYNCLCRVEHDSTGHYFSRRHCLSRWVFCDVHQIPEGAQRWKRYFIARRTIEARLDTGRPGRDYKVSERVSKESACVCV